MQPNKGNKYNVSPAPLFVLEIENFGSVRLLILDLAAFCLEHIDLRSSM